MNAPWIDDEQAALQAAGSPDNGSATPVQKALKIERETHKLEKRLCRQVGQAIVDYNLIEAGDRIMVCMSGGKTATACWTFCSSSRPAPPLTLS